ncbi:hypothetical protein ACSEO6_31885, partial [Pseudomonas aeruginosa]
RKGTTLLGHQTPLYGEHSRPKWVSGISRPLHDDPAGIGGGNEVLFCWETAFAAAEWLIDSHGEGSPE